MERKASFVKLVRSFHRDVGALVVGLTLIFCVSGVVLVFRDVSFLKSPREVELQVQQGLSGSQVLSQIRVKNAAVVSETDELVQLNIGDYNKTTGVVSYTAKEYPPVLKNMVDLHKAPSGKLIHWVGLLYGVLLLLLALSSFWMYKPGTKMFKRFLSVAGVGASIALIVLSAA